MATDKGELERPIDLDMSLDDIEDVPGFGVFPTGAYIVDLVKGIEQKEINSKRAAVVEMTLVEVAELKEDRLDEGEKPPMAGDICTLSFMLGNKFGADGLKKFLLPIAAKLGTNKLSELFHQSKGLRCMIVLRRTYNEDKDQHYAKLKKLAII